MVSSLIWSSPKLETTQMHSAMDEWITYNGILLCSKKINNNKPLIDSAAWMNVMGIKLRGKGANLKGLHTV